MSRVLVYRHECPERAIGLTRYPATQAPANGTKSVMPNCAKNSNHSDTSNPSSLVCTAEGKWMNDQTECKCDIGYSRDGKECEGM